MDGATVLVRGDMEKNKAFIAVQGAVKQRKEHLAIVRDAFRYVHSTIPALGPAEEVPLPDNPAVAVPYDHLLKLEEHGERTYFPPGADKSYSVTELLNGVDSTRYQKERRNRMRKEQRGMSEKHVFVSYCHDNKDDVARLVEDLKNAGEPVWWDDDILGGRDWKEAIREAMKNAYAVVVCLSPELTEERYRSGRLSRSARRDCHLPSIWSRSHLHLPCAAGEMPSPAHRDRRHADAGADSAYRSVSRNQTQRRFA